MATISAGYSQHATAAYQLTVIIRARVYAGYSQQATQEYLAAAIYGHAVQAGRSDHQTLSFAPWRVKTAAIPTPAARTLTV